jgi:hypothetical protein
MPAHALSHERTWKVADLGIAVFVHDELSGDVLQALAMPVCPG